jgi:hypothetical protein
MVLRGHEQRVSYPSKQMYAGYQTLRNNFRFEYLREFETELEKNSVYEPEVHMVLIHEKTRGQNLV